MRLRDSARACDNPSDLYCEVPDALEMKWLGFVDVRDDRRIGIN